MVSEKELKGFQDLVCSCIREERDWPLGSCKRKRKRKERSREASKDG